MCLKVIRRAKTATQNTCGCSADGVGLGGGAFLQPLSQRFQEGNGTSGPAKIKEADKHLFLLLTCVELAWRKE